MEVGKERLAQTRRARCDEQFVPLRREHLGDVALDALALHPGLIEARCMRAELLASTDARAAREQARRGVTEAEEALAAMGEGNSPGEKKRIAFYKEKRQLCRRLLPV